MNDLYILKPPNSKSFNDYAQNIFCFLYYLCCAVLARITLKNTFQRPRIINFVPVVSAQVLWARPDPVLASWLCDRFISTEAYQITIYTKFFWDAFHRNCMLKVISWVSVPNLHKILFLKMNTFRETTRWTKPTICTAETLSWIQTAPKGTKLNSNNFRNGSNLKPVEAPPHMFKFKIQELS